MKNKATLAVFFFIISTYNLISQEQPKNHFVQWTTWSLIQIIPSPGFYQDKKNDDFRLQFGLKWNITPFNYSFNSNKLTTPSEFFKVNPLRRYGGSVELFIQPEWTTNSFKYADLGRFSISSGIRSFFPLVEYGEYLSSSIGFKYTIRKNKQAINKNVFAIELGSYIFYGIIGLNFTYNFAEDSRYNLSFNLKYY